MARAAGGVIPRRASLTTGRPGGSVLFMLFMQLGRLTLFAVDALSSLDTEEPLRPHTVARRLPKIWL